MFGKELQDNSDTDPARADDEICVQSGKESGVKRSDAKISDGTKFVLENTDTICLETQKLHSGDECW